MERDHDLLTHGGGQVPRPALWLGLAGLIPPVFLTAAALSMRGDFWPVAPGFVRSYAAIILSFLGGTWWAFALREERPRFLLLLISVVPSLAGWAAMFWFTPSQALFALALLLWGALAIDYLLVRRGLAPQWWMKLRLPLSIGLGLCCALSGLALVR